MEASEERRRMRLLQAGGSRREGRYPQQHLSLPAPPVTTRSDLTTV